MSDSINLLRNTKAQLLQKKKSVAILRWISYGSLVFVLISALVVFFLKLESPLPALKQQESQAKSQLSLQNERIIKYLFVEQRTTEIADILGKRRRYDQTAKTVTSGIPASLAIRDLSIEDSAIKISLAGTSLLLINDAISYIDGLVGTNKAFQQVVLDTMSYDTSSQSYIAVLKITVL